MYNSAAHHFQWYVNRSTINWINGSFSQYSYVYFLHPPMSFLLSLTHLNNINGLINEAITSHQACKKIDDTGWFVCRLHFVRVSFSCSRYVNISLILLRLSESKVKCLGYWTHSKNYAKIYMHESTWICYQSCLIDVAIKEKKEKSLLVLC